MGSRRPLLLGGGPPQRQPAVPGSNTTIRCFRLLERRRHLLRYMLSLVVRLISVVSLEFPIPVAPFRPSATRPPARPGQPRRPTRRPAPGACGSAPAPARGARAGQACSGQDRPSWEPGYPSTRDRSTSQVPAPAMAATPRAIIPLSSRPAGRSGPGSRRTGSPEASATRRVGDASLGHSPRLGPHSKRVQRYPAVRSGPRSFRPAGDPADSGWRGEHSQG